MNLEVELKAPAPRGIEKKLLTIGAKELDTITIKDDYYDKPGEPLRKKKVTLRIRNENGRLLITHKVPVPNKKVKVMEENEFPISPAMDLLLRGLGYKVTLTMKKKRTTYKLGSMNIVIDRVEKLGKWVEFEMFGDPEKARKKILTITEKLGISEKELTTKSYPPLLREKLKKMKRVK